MAMDLNLIKVTSLHKQNDGMQLRIYVPILVRYELKYHVSKA